MKQHGIKAIGKRKFKATTYSNHNKPIAENLLKQKFDISQPNTIWAGDIMYIATNESWLYLAVESFFHSLKVERVYNMKYKTREEAKSDIFNYIEMFYNANHMHSTLGYLSPTQFEMQNWKADAA